MTQDLNSADCHQEAPSSSKRDRRSFLARLATIGAAVGLGSPVAAHALDENAGLVEAQREAQRSDPWMKRLSGKSRVVFHSHMPTEGLAIRWAEIYLNTQKSEYGLGDKDLGVIVGLNGKSIGWLFNDSLWGRYATIGEVMGSKTAKNPMAPIVASLIPRGVIVLACKNSLGLSGSRFLPEPARSDAAAQAAFGEEALKNLLPGVEVVPSMIVTLQQAQDRGCRYVYAGS